MAQKIQIKSCLKAELPILDIGEFGLCTDTNELFIGSEKGNLKFAPNDAIGVLSSLNTNSKTNLVNSINEINARDNLELIKASNTNGNIVIDGRELRIFNDQDIKSTIESKANTIHDHTINSITDIDTNTIPPSVGDYLSYNGTNWIPTQISNTISSSSYLVELNRWGIKNDKTDSINTVKGINDAFLWAYENNFSYVSLPKGEYLVPSSSSIQPQNNTFYDFGSSKIYMEPNDQERTAILNIGSSDATKKAHHITISNAEFIGDRYAHDYSPGGTHEWGHCIALKGHCKFITIFNCIMKDATGDGFIAEGIYNVWLYPTSSNFEPGGINEGTGSKQTSQTTIRTINPYDVSHFRVTNNDNKFMLTGNGYGTLYGITTDSFDIFFYDSNNNFISALKNKTWYEDIERPTGAKSMHFVLKQTSLNGIAFEVRAEPRPEFITIENCEIFNNRRIGITGATIRHFFIKNNIVHDNNGYVGVGIDIEDGYRSNQNIYILGNKLYGHGINDIIFVGTYYVTVQRNSLTSNLSGSGNHWNISNNFFQKSGGSIFADNVIFSNNNSHDAAFSFGAQNKGRNIIISCCTFFNSSIALNQQQPYAINVDNCSFYNDADKNRGSSISSFNYITRLKNLTIIGREKTGATLIASEGTLVENSTFINPKFSGSYWLKYKNCKIVKPIVMATGNELGKQLVFESCDFTISERFLTFNSPGSDLKLIRCKVLFENNALDFISITDAKMVLFSDCEFIAPNAKSGAFIKSSGLNKAFVIIAGNKFYGTSTNVNAVEFTSKLTVEPTLYYNNTIDGIAPIPHIIGETHNSGSTITRPQRRLTEGLQYFDTSLGKPIYIKSKGTYGLYSSEAVLRNKGYRLGHLVIEDGRIYECHTPGITGNEKPIFNTHLDDTTEDGTVIWICKGNPAIWVNSNGSVI
ncbi:right-handed parallel beta-helix repeat-containing protein [Guptibacillus sedimenti]|uniref:right-handed parallel beta-helix repeat-containing protein n=1 Tax=Guptibacillus sedimenti TaxID=3025680 RepID=UPI00235FFF9C|nr:right-handed parallel beta-helix repeat-containing protein [Pseudalkalibacillus sedimenti]